MTKLDKPLKRELQIGDIAYVITISPEELKITEKGRRNGTVLAWKDLIGGDAAVATALNASIAEK